VKILHVKCEQTVPTPEKKQHQQQTNHLLLSTTSVWVSEESALPSEALQVTVGREAMVQDVATLNMTAHSQNNIHQSTAVRK